MAVDPEITRLHLREELGAVRELAATNRWGIVPDFGRLVVLATMYAHTGDLFILEIQCDNYREIPPLFEFIDPVTGERGTKNAYPKAKDSLFHTSGPCICAPFNRKAYKSVVETGPHSDWALGDWQTSTANNVQWANFSKIGDMLGVIYSRLSRPDWFEGRMK
ncbi:MAG TPA: hypothetical protein VEA99_20625 [Gemmatimonadaceae bacterium]|nr:hypothetical protein [Gemmatimonadaceae bacterium]